MSISIENLGSKAIGLTVHGKPAEHDFELFRPYLTARIEANGKVGLLVNVDEHSRFTPATLWNELKFTDHDFSAVNRLALVRPESNEKRMAELARPFSRAVVKYFSLPEIHEARHWIRGETN